MKQASWLSLAACASLLAACNGNSNNTTNPDSTSTTMTTTTSTASNPAWADSFRVNSEAGNYLDARTGKPIRIKYDATAKRAVNEETNEPVWRYVDRRNWWVYAPMSDRWDTVGMARMQGSAIQYHDMSTDNWVGYDERWHDADSMYMTESGGATSTDMSSGSSDGGETKVKDHGNKVKDDNVKVKTSKDGDVKIKDMETGEKTKYNAQNGKVKSGH